VLDKSAKITMGFKGIRKYNYGNMLKVLLKILIA